MTKTETETDTALAEAFRLAKEALDLLITADGAVCTKKATVPLLDALHEIRTLQEE